MPDNLSDLRQISVSRHISLNVPIIKFHKNLSSGSPADTRGHTDGRTDMTKLLGAFRDYENVPKKHRV